jgi:hypothetical protein
MFGRLRDAASAEGSLTGFLLLFLVAIFISPMIDSLPIRLLTSLFFSLLVLAGSFAMSRQPAVRYLSVAVASLVILLRWLMHFAPSPAILRLGTLASLLFLITLTAVIFSRVFRNSGVVTTHRINGALAVYLLFGIAWSILYALLDQTLPNAFSVPAPAEFNPERQQSLTYFSFITLTTVGYGDITPTHDVARMFAVLEALTGQLYPATLLARLVSLEIMHRGRDKAE